MGEAHVHLQRIASIWLQRRGTRWQSHQPCAGLASVRHPCPTRYLQSFSFQSPWWNLALICIFPRWSWAQIPFWYWQFAYHLLCSTYSSTLPFISFLLGLSFFFLICGSILDTRPLSDTCVARTSTRSAVIFLLSVISVVGWTHVAFQWSLVYLFFALWFIPFVSFWRNSCCSSL